jgi:hypothetical protein
MRVCTESGVMISSGILVLQLGVGVCDASPRETAAPGQAQEGPKPTAFIMVGSVCKLCTANCIANFSAAHTTR